ncbi:MAG TPA: tRNA glutamyl-Q(34) synthetase GluQRS [Polyangiaceae bacterium]|nr:tRNA glutamyl-Q(34) synthetase GluQRS [Polyangiaceae bacterium]
MSDALLEAESRKRVGRLAPSPTGLLHLGHARTFLIAWWRARSSGARLLMRLEDLDGPRVRPEMSEAALRDLAWLGLDWDGPAHVQSSGLEEISAAATRLAHAGLAYACVCSRGEVRSAQSAPQQGDSEPRYPGTCQNEFRSLAEAEAQTGKSAGLRLRVREGQVKVSDLLLGTRSFDVQAEVGDFLIAKRDGAPAYQLAVVVDDARQGVTEVVRGEDLLPSAARQCLLQQALGLPGVTYCHVPLVVDETGRRLAKRHDDLSLAELRASGTDPRAIVAWAARSSGIAAEPRATPAEVLPAFALSSLPREPIQLDALAVAALRAARI